MSTTTTEKTPDLTALRDELAAARLAADAAFNPEALQAETRERLAEYIDPEGRWHDAPDSDKVKAFQRVEAEQEKRKADALVTLKRVTDAVSERVEPAIAAARVAPDALTAYTSRYRGYSADAEVQVGILQELVLARLHAAQATMTPAAVLEVYERALVGYRTADAVTVQWVEATHGGGWAGAPDASAEGMSAARRLTKCIAAAQEARVPQDLWDRREQVKEARSFRTRMQTVRHAL